MPIKVFCYNEIRSWNSRKQAIAFYKKGIKCSDGRERMRYENILNDLENGEMICIDNVYDYDRYIWEEKDSRTVEESMIGIIVNSPNAVMHVLRSGPSNDAFELLGEYDYSNYKYCPYNNCFAIDRKYYNQHNLNKRTTVEIVIK